jgi:hypothetical protein
MNENGKKHGRMMRRGAIVLAAAGAAAAVVAATSPALASTAAPAKAAQAAHLSVAGPRIHLTAVTPRPGDTAGAGGVFNVDLLAQAVNGAGNKALSAANGYVPGIANPAPGIGHPDTFAPGLVLELSTTPAAVGGPKANVMGVFQLTDVARSHGLNQVIADWTVGKAGLFGAPGTKVTLTAFVVSGTAPGVVTGKEHPISNVVRETFRVG